MNDAKKQLFIRHLLELAPDKQSDIEEIIYRLISLSNKSDNKNFLKSG